MNILAELSGEHSELPRAEVIAVAETSVKGNRIIGDGTRTIIVNIPSKSVREFCVRLALTHTVNQVLITSKS